MHQWTRGCDVASGSVWDKHISKKTLKLSPRSRSNTTSCRERRCSSPWHNRHLSSPGRSQLYSEAGAVERRHSRHTAAEGRGSGLPVVEEAGRCRHPVGYTRGRKVRVEPEDSPDCMKAPRNPAEGAAGIGFGGIRNSLCFPVSICRRFSLCRCS